MLRARFAVAAIAVLALSADSADAAIIELFGTPTPDAATGGTRFTYEIDLPADFRLETGDFFTIYDFAGLIPGTVTFTPSAAFLALGGDFTIEMNPQGRTPNVPISGEPVLVADDASVENITALYSGPTFGQGETVEFNLGYLSAVSKYSGTIDDNFSVDITNDTGAIDVDGTAYAAAGVTSVPAAVPEPSSMLLTALGAVGAWGAMRRRRPKCGAV